MTAEAGPGEYRSSSERGPRSSTPACPWRPPSDWRRPQAELAAAMEAKTEEVRREGLGRLFDGTRRKDEAS